jgi:DNA-binding response OmpR family regulator
MHVHLFMGICSVAKCEVECLYQPEGYILMTSQTTTTTKEIIVCDDDEDILDYLCALLKEAGYAPLKARGMYEVFPYIRNREPRLLLLDIRMPDYDGFEVAETLRRNSVVIPIIFLTAHDNMFSRVYSPIVGASGFFTKPIDDTALLERIQQLVAD